MKKYSTLQCSICKRTKDELINVTHYSPDKCIITLNCEGRLFIVGSTSDGKRSVNVPPIGLSNWQPRESSQTQVVNITEDVLFDTSTGTKKQCVLAVSDFSLGFVPGSQAVFVLNLIAEQQTAKDYRQYTYRKSTPFTVVNGVEDAQAKKVLRYNITGAIPDVVEVFVNGVKRNNGLGIEDYQLNDGSLGSLVPPNSVLFNTVITNSSTQVDVIVTKAAAVSTASLTFNRMVDDEARVNIGSWEGINYISSPGLNGNYSLFYCDFAEIGASLGIDVKFRIDSNTQSYVKDTPLGPNFNINNASFLLSRSKVFTQIDRNRSCWVPITELNTNAKYLVAKLIDGNRTLLVTEAAKKDLFPALTAHRYSTVKLQSSNLSGNSESAELDNEIIIGPDV